MFFDLNLCCQGGKDFRRDAASRLILGYTGVAANRVVSGMMQESDRCNPVPLDISVSAEDCDFALLHRQLLGVPAKTPFRQYRRLTVVVEDQVQAAPLNSANPVVQSYDLVAVQPMNERMFAQACDTMEVDIISLNMCEKLAFKIKPALARAAIQRGIHFEICYGPSLTDLKARKHLFANAQTLVEATRGRNIIVSSGAKAMNEMRGPLDVSNLASLLGLGKEQAKRAVSKNCNAVLLRGFSRKNTLNGAIAIERGFEKPLFDVPTAWDPLSTKDEFVGLEAVEEVRHGKGKRKAEFVILEEVCYGEGKKKTDKAS